jgi:class 3 adenylate cyclase
MPTAARPTSTPTFLFTDIEGSTRLWEAHPDAMHQAVARHDALVRQNVEAHGGFVFKTLGDAFCAAFGTAPDALAAALGAQQALHAEPWPEAVRIRARMALHTGASESRDGDYFGPQLNHVARLLAIGHGGQTLVSKITCDLCRDRLPSGAALKSLGEHGLASRCFSSAMPICRRRFRR